MQRWFFDHHLTEGTARAEPVKGWARLLRCPAQTLDRPPGSCAASSVVVVKEKTVQGESGGPGSMRLLGSQEDRGIIGLPVRPGRKDYADPEIGQRPRSDWVGLAFLPLALIVGQRPRLEARTLPGKLVTGVAQDLITRVAPMRFGKIAALKGHRRGPGQSLQAARILIPCAVIAPFGQQTGSQAFPRPRQAREQVGIRMRQKKAFNFLVIGCNRVDDGGQLLHQGQHQAGFGARGNGIRLQLGAMHLLPDRLRLGFRTGKASGLQHGQDLCVTGGLGSFQGGIGLQEGERCGLVQLGEQLQRDGVVGFEAGRKLIEQSRLHLDEAILVAGQLLEFLHQRTVGLQAPQLIEIAAAFAGQQIRIDGIGLSSGGLTPFLQGFGIHWVDRQTRLQQGGNQQAFVGLDNARHVVRVLADVADAFDKRHQVRQTLGTLRDAFLVQLFAEFINDHHVMVLISPVNADIPHRPVLLGVLSSPRSVVALYSGARGAAFYDRFTRKSADAGGGSS